MAITVNLGRNALNPGHVFGKSDDDRAVKSVANALGISVAEVRRRRAAGESLQLMVKSDEEKRQIDAVISAAFNTPTAYGKMSQEDADRLIRQGGMTLAQALNQWGKEQEAAKEAERKRIAAANADAAVNQAAVLTDPFAGPVAKNIMAQNPGIQPTGREVRDIVTHQNQPAEYTSGKASAAQGDIKTRMKDRLERAYWNKHLRDLGVPADQIPAKVEELVRGIWEKPKEAATEKPLTLTPKQQFDEQIKTIQLRSEELWRTREENIFFDIAGELGYSKKDLERDGNKQTVVNDILATRRAAFLLGEEAKARRSVGDNQGFLDAINAVLDKQIEDLEYQLRLLKEGGGDLYRGIAK